MLLRNFRYTHRASAEKGGLKVFSKKLVIKGKYNSSKNSQNKKYTSTFMAVKLIQQLL